MARASVSIDPQFDSTFQHVESQYMPEIIDEIRRTVERQDDGSADYRSIVRAFERYFDTPQRDVPWWIRFGRAVHDNLFLLVAVLMTIIFGVLGYPSGGRASAIDPATAKSFLDIAKIFAGAIVGSAATSVGSSSGSRGTSKRRSVS